MKRPVTDEDNAHPDELLPWYANGTLAEAERTQVAAHLAKCSRCRDELAFLTSLQAGVRAVAEEDAAGTPGEFGLKRLLRDVGAEQTRPSPASAARSWWRPALAAAAVLIIVVQGVTILQMHQSASRLTPLSGPAPAGAVVQVRFDPDAREAQIRAALQAVGGDLVSGPGALGIYRVRLGDLEANAPAVAQRIAELRARRGVIDYVAKD